jgi:hypothetical protein
LARIKDFEAMGATSFDTTSPLRQAFKDDKDNYHTLGGNYIAVRVPQVEGNPKLQRRIRAGEVNPEQARRMEQRTLEALRALDRDPGTLEAALSIVLEYEALCDGSKDREPEYRRTLGDAPWRSCRCEVCQTIGINVIIFRGAERNRRRGFHNLKVLGWRLDDHRTRSSAPAPVAPTGKRPRKGKASA